MSVSLRFGMDSSSEVANINMRTDAKNKVTAARTIRLPEITTLVQEVFMILHTFQLRIVWQIV